MTQAVIARRDKPETPEARDCAASGFTSAEVTALQYLWLEHPKLVGPWWREFPG